LNQDQETLLQSEDQQTKSLQASRVGPPQIPGYELQLLLGTGSYGQVWGGLQKSTGQRVAVKVFGERCQEDLDYVRRELDRLKEVADHPSVVGLLDANLDHHPAFFVMPWLAQSLSQRVRAGKTTMSELAEWMKELAAGLQHTHEKGLLHCDLKPSNVMLDDCGKVRLADFGQSRQQGEGSVAWGTLGYMAPEQALLGQEVNHSVPSVRWDIYGLGASFYRILTGRCPYLRDEDLQNLQALPLQERLPEYRQRLLKARYRPARQLNPLVDQDLSDILGACLERDPEKRTAAMALVLEDLERRSRGEPLLCRQPWPLSYRLRKLMRKPVVAVGTGLSLLILLGSIYSFGRLSASYQAQQQLVASLLNQTGNQRQRQGLDEEAPLWWSAALPLMASSPQRQLLEQRLSFQHFALLDWRTRVTSCAPGPRHDYLYVENGQFYLADANNPKKAPRKIAIESGFEALEARYHWQSNHWLLLCTNLRTPTRDGILLVWNPSLHKQLAVVPLAGSALTSAFQVGSENRLMAFSGGSQLACWSLRDGKLRWRTYLDPEGKSSLQAPALAGDFSGAEFSPRGGWLLVHQGPGQSLLLDLRQAGPPSTVKSLGPCSNWASRGNFSDDDRSFHFNGQIRRLDGLETQTLQGSFLGFLDEQRTLIKEGHKVLVSGSSGQPLELAHDEDILAAVGAQNFLLSQTTSGTLHLWDLASGTLLTRKTGQALDRFNFWGSAEAFFLESRNGPWKAWKLDPPTPLWSSRWSQSPFVGLEHDPGRPWLVTAQPLALSWVNPQGKLLRSLPLPEPLRRIRLTGQGQVLAEGGDSSLFLVDGGPENPQIKKLGTLSARADSNWAHAADRITMCQEQSLGLWDHQGKSLGQVLCPTPTAVALSSDGQYLAALRPMGLLQSQQFCLWRLPAQEPVTVADSLAALKSTQGPIQLEFGPNNQWVLARSNDAYAVLEIPSGKVLAHWQEPSWLHPFCIAPGGDRVLLATGQGLARMRSLPDGEPLGSYLSDVGRTQLLRAAAFSPASGPLVMALSNQVLLMDPLSGVPFMPPLPAPEVEHCRWGKALYVADHQGRLQCWDVLGQSKGPSQEALTGLRLNPGRASLSPLSRDEWLKQLP